MVNLLILNLMPQWLVMVGMKNLQDRDIFMDENFENFWKNSYKVIANESDQNAAIWLDNICVTIVPNVPEILDSAEKKFKALAEKAFSIGQCLLTSKLSEDKNNQARQA